MESIIPEEYDTEEEEYKHVTVFSELKTYMKKTLLSLPPYGNRMHTGPLNNETSLILKYLIRIFDNNFITLDSQPGLIIIGGNTINRPYVFLYGENNRIDKLYDIILNHDFLAIINYPKETDEIKLNFFPSYIDFDKYKQIYIGTRHINSDETIENYYELIFNDYFFIELIRIIESL